MQGRVDRVPAEPVRVLGVGQKRPRRERQLQDVVDELEAGAVAELVAHLQEAARGESVAGREPDVLVVEPAQDVPEPLPVIWIALEVRVVPLDETDVRGRVDVVDRPRDRRQAAGEERLAQASRKERQVGHRAEAAETLAEDAPAVDAQLLADQLGIAHDRVGAHVGHVRELLRGGRAGDIADRRAPARPALVDEQDAVIGDRSLLPARWRGRRSGRFAAGTALLEDQVWAIEAIGRGELAAEDGDPLAVGPSMVEGHLVLALGQHPAGNVIRDGRHRTLPSLSAAIDLSMRRLRVFGVFAPATWLVCHDLFE